MNSADSPPIAARGQPPSTRGTTPTGTQSTARLAWRRAAFAALVLATMGGLGAAFWTVAAWGGWSTPEIVMFACFLASSPWIVIGFWNGVIGLALLRLHPDPTAQVNPCAARSGDADPIVLRTALVACIRHEDVDRLIRRLDVILESLDATGWGAAFDVHVLSDSSRDGFVVAEHAAIAAWRARLPHPERLRYRRRPANAGFKAGNVRDFVCAHGDAYDLMIPLDADSLMSGEAILRLVRVMQANPRLGILQSLVVGLPARTPFARLFQFGMRAGMRSYTMGAAWWMGDAGPYWGHNAAVRVKPFRDHAELPVVPGAAPLGGAVLSHDQLEAALMRRAGYEVRVLPEEGGSWEDNPPSLPEFLRRDLRWCQGNMQYLKLLGLPGLLAISRIQLLLAILMYVGAPAWIVFLIAGAAQAWGAPAVIGAIDPAAPFPAGLGAGLFMTMMVLTFTPKLMGYLDVLVRKGEAARYVGRVRFLAGAVVELLFGALLAPIVSVAVTGFLARLFLLGRAVGWEAQDRDGDRVGWREAAARFWAPTAFGAALGLSLALSAPQVLPWASPVLASLLLAIPFATLTSIRPAEGEGAARLAAVPEEVSPPLEVRALDVEPNVDAAELAA